MKVVWSITLEMDCFRRAAKCRRTDQRLPPPLRGLVTLAPFDVARTSPTVMPSGARDSQISRLQRPPRFDEAALLPGRPKINSRNFCGIFCRRAVSAILIGSPGLCKARSKIAWSAYSPFTDMFNLHLPTRGCTATPPGQGSGFPEQLGIGPANIIWHRPPRDRSRVRADFRWRRCAQPPRQAGAAR